MAAVDQTFGMVDQRVDFGHRHIAHVLKFHLARRRQSQRQIEQADRGFIDQRHPPGPFRVQQRRPAAQTSRDWRGPSGQCLICVGA